MVNVGQHSWSTFGSWLSISMFTLFLLLQLFFQIQRCLSHHESLWEMDYPLSKFVFFCVCRIVQGLVCKMLQCLFSNMCYGEEVFKGSQSHLHWRAWHQAFFCGFFSQRFLIRIVGCIKKGKSWKTLMGWYVRSVCM
jgi:hypothetical protein